MCFTIYKFKQFEKKTIVRTFKGQIYYKVLMKRLNFCLREGTLVTAEASSDLRGLKSYCLALLTPTYLCFKFHWNLSMTSSEEIKFIDLSQTQI